MSVESRPPELVLSRGLPGSGKTTWAKYLVSRHPDYMVRVSRDDIRKSVFGSDKTTGPNKNLEENAITKMQIDMIRNLLMIGKTVIVDDMNLSEHAIERFYNLAQEFEGVVRLRFQDHMTSLKECIANDLKRKEKGERYVGEKNIREISKRYMYGGSELPTLPVKYYSRIGPLPTLSQDESLPKAWLVDIDGTISNMYTDDSSRTPYDFDRVDEDHPIDAVVELVRVLHQAGYKIVLVTGRDEISRELTKIWLDVYEIPYDELLMRPLDDQRADKVVKAEIYDEKIKGTYFVAGILDDRKQVVDMWRSKGLLVAQVAPGLF